MGKSALTARTTSIAGCASAASTVAFARPREEDLVAGEAPRGEGVLEQAAQGAVAFAVRLEHRLADLALLGVQLLEVGAAHLGGERCRVAGDPHDVGVPGDRPEAVVGCGLVVPVQRVAVPERVEEGPGPTLFEGVEVGEVDVHGGRGHGGLLAPVMPARSFGSERAGL